MSIFKKLFGGEKAEVPPVEEVNNVEAEVPALVEDVVEHTPAIDELAKKTLGDVIIAKKDLEQLEADKKVLVEKHRDTISQLIDSGVNESQGNSIARSETYNEILNPIENDIKKIAEEISDIREDFDMQKSRKEILESRMGRLNELCFINVTEFLNTEVGKNFLEIIKPKDPNEVANVQLDEKDPVKYASYIFRYCDTNKGTSEITEKVEYKDFINRHIKIVKLMDKVDSKLMDVNRGN